MLIEFFSWVAVVVRVRRGEVFNVFSVVFGIL